MIAWTLTLSGQQIKLLRLTEHRDLYDRQKEDKIGLHPNTIPGMRALTREGLVEHREIKNAAGYIDTGKSGYFITSRGLFILKMIETDIDKYLSVEDQAKAKKSLRKVS